MSKISNNFSYKEATRSQTAIRHSITNRPNEGQLQNMRRLAKEILEPIRTYFKRPVFVSSWFRCYTLNKMIGGSDTSQHTTGEAVDIDCDSRNVEIFDYIKDNLVWDQLLWEYGDDKNPAWVHVSFTQEGTNRMQILKVSKKNGKTVYTPM